MLRRLDYQTRVLDAIDAYLDTLNAEKDKSDQIAQLADSHKDLDLAVPDFAEEAWKSMGAAGKLPASRATVPFSPRYEVAEEATSKCGLTVEPLVGKAADFHPPARAAYEDAERVAITTYSGLFNTNPYFRDPSLVVLDDVHASENYIADLWTFRVRRAHAADEPLFRTIVGVLKGSLDGTSYAKLVGDRSTDAGAAWVDKIPTPRLAAVADELHAAIDAYMDDAGQRYAWRMIGDHLRACQMYVSQAEILIRPLVPPTWTHAPFRDADQRIYLSATLGAGGDLERLTGRRCIRRLPIPDGWDRQGIGRRFFAFPEKSLATPDVAALRRRLMVAAGRSVVLTPSDNAAQTIVDDVEEHLGYPVYSGRDLEQRKAYFVSSDQAVAVIANRYDGIDLPGDDCRLLFVEGLPRTVNLQERFFVTRMGASLLFNERIQTRVLQAVGRCTRGLADHSMVVVTGDDLPAYLTNIRRRRHFHPELQAELEFGVEQSTEVDADTFVDNSRIFLEHAREWEEANASILESRDRAAREDFPAMTELDAAVAHEIAWQTALWDGDHGAAYESAREVLGKLGHDALRGYRMLWHYLAGSAAALATREGTHDLAVAAAEQFQRAKSCSPGVGWLVGLAHSAAVAPTAAERERATVMLQVENLETYLLDLGVLHNRRFSAREREIREGLATAERFEQAQFALGRHLGFDVGKRETDGAPDPWWCIGDLAIVFEDHADGEPGGVIHVTKARQAASHPAWLAANVLHGSAETAQAVLVSPATRASDGALPHLAKVAYWNLTEFRSWAHAALDAVREIRADLPEPGDLEWRGRAADRLEAVGADGPGLVAWLKARPADGELTPLP
ncbi:MAG: DEAD/DEAH box helicase [Gammaproteobacteria bacterium]|nr:DEAD/DEAH box helicase [Gammaproteobacteria bacterium]